MKILNSLKKAYTEGIYADTPANRKLGRVGMSYSEYASKQKNEEGGESEKWASAIKYKEDRELAKKAADIFLQLGVKLPNLEHKPIPKQGNFQPVSGYDKAFNTIIINSSLNVTKKGKEYKEKGWNVQDNPILHELSHYLAYQMDPSGYSKEDFFPVTEEEREKICKEVSIYASWSQKEFNAELIAGLLSGKTFSKEIMSFSNLKLNKEGKTPQEILAPGIEFYHQSEDMLDRILRRRNLEIQKAYVEGIYADTPANRKLGRVGMSYAAYAEKIKNEEEEKAEKKYYHVTAYGDEFMLEEGKTSQKKAIDLAIEYVTTMVRDNHVQKMECTLEENTDDWEIDDFDKKKWDWFTVSAERYGDKIEISVYDFNKHKYIRNDRAKREEKNLAQRLKREQEKSDREFKEKYGWMEEFLKYKEQQKTNPVNEKMKKTIQSFLRDKDINSFQLGYGGYLFSNKDSKGNYGKLSLSMIREQDLESIKEMLHEENIDYKVENKVMSSQKGMIKDVSIIFNNKE